MNTITSVLAAALIASVSFATAAVADTGDYYQSMSRQAPAVDFLSTGSINSPVIPSTGTESHQPLGHGDYYQGANRPT